MDWIDDTVAVGDWIDGFFAQRRRHEGIDIIIDSRNLFTQNIIPHRRSPLVDLLMRAQDLLVDIAPLEPKVLIYCNQGRDRSPFVAMLYVSKRYGMSYQEAYELVKSKRKESVFHWDWVRSVSQGTS